MSNNSQKKLEECPLPATIKNEKSPSSRRSGSPDQPEFPSRRIRASSWDDSEDETSKPNCAQTSKEVKETYEDEGKSQDNPDRRQSPARIRRRRRSSSGSSIISENALDERVISEIKQVGDVIHEKVEDATKEIEAKERILPPKKLPPVDPNSAKKNCANPEILQELSKNINSMFFGGSGNKAKGKGKERRVKSSDVEKRKKEKFIRPESEKIARSDKSQNNSPKVKTPEVTIVEEIGKNPEEELETIIVQKNEERPKSASFLIMEDLEDVDENEIYKNESKRTDRTKSAGESSGTSYQWKASEKSSSCGIEFLTSGESSGSKISDIHNWSGRESDGSPKRGYDSERWCHNFSGSQRSFSRTEKSPYSERGQLTSPTDSTEKSVDSEFMGKKSKLEIDPHPSPASPPEKNPHKDLFIPENNFGLGDSRDVQCWNVGNPEISSIEEPQDHGDGNFRQLTNEETWQRLMSQVEEKKKNKNRFWSDVHEKLNKPDSSSWILNTEDEKFKKRDDSSSPKKSKWSLVGSVAKPMSSSSDASTQCTILQDKEPSSRKRKRTQLAKSRIIREEVVIERSTPLEIEKIKKVPTPKKKEVTFDYNEITICEAEESNENDNFLIPRKSREKETTNYKNFLAKSEICEVRLSSKGSLTRKLQMWKNQRSGNNLATIQESETDLPDQKNKAFYSCACFQVLRRVISNFFKTGR